MDAVEALTRLGGVATVAELMTLTSRRRLRTAVSAGRIVRVAAATYALPGAEGARLAAARLGGVVSHLSAAEHWGWKLKLPPALPEVTVPRNRCHLERDGVDVHWADLLPHQLCGRVTSRVETVVGCARDHSFDVALSVADSALRAGVRRDDVLAAAHLSPRTGRTRVIRVAEAADPRAANPFESVLRSIALEVPGLCVEPQQWVGHVGRVDLLDVRLGLVIEAESFQFHSDRRSLARDVRRYTAMTRLGLRVVRFTWEEVMFDPEHVRAVLTDVVALGPATGALSPGSVVRRR